MEFEYVIGKNAVGNTELCQTAASKDVWFHIANVPSAHLIYRNPTEISLEKLRTNGTIFSLALQLKKAHPKYSKIPELAVIYTYIENIKVTKTPGLVITKSTKTIRI